MTSKIIYAVYKPGAKSYKPSLCHLHAEVLQVCRSGPSYVTETLLQRTAGSIMVIVNP